MRQIGAIMRKGMSSMSKLPRLARAERVKVLVASAAIVAIMLAATIPSCGSRLLGSMVGAGVDAVLWGASLGGASDPVTLDEPIDLQEVYDAGDVRDLSVEWRGGVMRMQRGSDDAVRVRIEVPAGSYEMDPSNPSCALSDGTLTIDDGLPGSDNGRPYPNASLTITLPASAGFAFDHVELVTVTAVVHMQGLACDALEVANVDGSVSFDSPCVRAMEVSDVDGTLEMSDAAVCTLEVNTVDGTQSLSFADELPARIEVSSVDGETQITIPEGAGFALSTDVLSSVRSDLPHPLEKTDEGAYIFGDGATAITVDGIDAELHLM